MMTYEPLRITFDMLTPVALPLRKKPYPMHFDSLVIGIMTNLKKEIFESINKDKYAPGQNPEVPLAVYGEKSPIYCASVAMIREDAQRGNYGITKKPPIEEEIRMFWKSENATFKQAGNSGGKHRAWMEEVQTVFPPQIIFECQGNKEALWEIITQVRRIGVSRRVGLGEVLDMRIESIDTPEAGLIYNEQPARMIPVADWPEGSKDWTKAVAAVRAPYWHPVNKELCWVPPVDTTIPNITVVDL